MSLILSILIISICFTSFINLLIDYKERMKGYTVANVSFGINAADSGMLIELEREIDNVVLGIDILYDPDHEELEDTKFIFVNL